MNTVRIALNEHWQFVSGHVSRQWLSGAGDTGSFVNLPHCWNTTEEFLRGQFYYRGPAAYRRQLMIPPLQECRALGEWRLKSGGFYGVGEVWLDGLCLERVTGDYIGFDVPLGVGLEPGPHWVAVRLTNKCNRHVLPGIHTPDFLLYGGLSSDVCMEFTPTVRIDDKTRQVHARDVMCSSTCITLKADVLNASMATQKGRVTWRMRDKNGGIVWESAQNIECPAAERLPVLMDARLTDVCIWDVDHPHLYSAEMLLDMGGSPVHTSCFTIGLRNAEFRKGDGFFLNGRRLELKGCNRHENMPGFGNALVPEIHAWDASQIRSMGMNFVRLSHYPQAPEFLDACDREGLLVLAELASWKSVRSGAWLRAARAQLTRMIARDAGHPCIVAWCIGNESRHPKVFRDLGELVEDKDPQRRPTLYAENHIRRAHRRRTVGLTDVWGCNYEIDMIGIGAAAARTGCAIVTEFANLPYARRGHLTAEAEQVRLIRKDLHSMHHSANAGFAIWSFNDYATLRKARYMRFCGVVDGWRRPKMAAGWFEARHAVCPVLYVWGAWGNAGARLRRIYVATNCERLKIKTMNVERLLPDPVDHWLEADVVFDGQPLVILGSWRGEAVETVLNPWGDPARIGMSTKVLGPRLALVRVQVEDREGRPVRVWNGRVEVCCTQGASAALLGGTHLPVWGGEACIWVRRLALSDESAVLTARVIGWPEQEVCIMWPHEEAQS